MPVTTLEEHNAKIASLPLESNLKMRCLLYGKFHQEAVERLHRIYEEGMTKIQKETDLGERLYLIERLNREYSLQYGLVKKYQDLSSIFDYIVDSFSLLDDNQHTFEELIGLL